MVGRLPRTVHRAVQAAHVALRLLRFPSQSIGSLRRTICMLTQRTRRPARSLGGPIKTLKLVFGCRRGSRQMMSAARRAVQIAAEGDSGLTRTVHRTVEAAHVTLRLLRFATQSSRAARRAIDPPVQTLHVIGCAVERATQPVDRLLDTLDRARGAILGFDDEREFHRSFRAAAMRSRPLSHCSSSRSSRATASLGGQPWSKTRCARRSRQLRGQAR